MFRRLFFLGLVFRGNAQQCGEICTDFVKEHDDLALCSARNTAQIWNTTSGECEVRLDADLDIVSYMSLIFSAGVTPGVRYQIGKNCWDYVPENVASAIMGNPEYFVHVGCESHPWNSPSLGWEMRYTMKIAGYNDCASVIVLHEDYLRSCVRLHADARALATLGYFIGILVFLCCCCVIPYRLLVGREIFE